MYRFLPASPRAPTSDISARMPPSPRLSARITSTRYLIEMMMISDQTMSDSTPMTFCGVGRTPCSLRKHSRSAYSGLVPMSPYTTPRAPRERVRRYRRLFCSDAGSIRAGAKVPHLLYSHFLDPAETAVQTGDRADEKAEFIHCGSRSAVGGGSRACAMRADVEADLTARIFSEPHGRS